MKTLQAVERLCGGIACSVLGCLAWLLPAGPVPTQNVRRVLLVKFWGIGSLVLAAPLFKKTRETFPGAEIILMTLSANKGVVKMLPGIDRVEFVDLGGSLASAVWAYLRCLHRAFRLGPDIIFDMEFYTKASAILSFFARAPMRVGYHSPGVWRGNIHNYPIAFNVYWHVSSNFLSMLEPFGVAPDSAPRGSELLGLEHCQGQARNVLSRLGLKPGTYILINVNAGELAVERRWPRERFAELSAKLCETYGLPAVFVGSKAETDYTSQAWALAEEAGATGRNLVGALSLDELVGLCGLSSLVITNDSGPLHLAVAAGARTVSFFGPETPVLYGPTGPDHLVMFADIPCSPCINAEHGKRTFCWRGTLHCQLGVSVGQALESIARRFGDTLKQTPPQAN
ncbi:MAG: glycosyltransferase family 9 protein [Humidesulfovibrio sp.]|uniref:glycosyltransferase family 9 protein n=1 Tax=Humidesulfovibrio sp. TaxID=2910988 RepID=UPI0027F861F9|nr:glycosyltransferase family 9 protein [Humidesulfovibrio sp.]MDQ7834286.1 glycosyltransferase family 9 protein [Humidesulfovibrio sp.]